MPDLVNKLDHPARVTDENGQPVRVVPGQVVSVDGKVADQLTAIDGIESASGEDKEAWEAQQGGLPSDIPSTRESAMEHYSEMRTRGRAASIAVPLNEVIGDNDAPLGPPSGTITTKQAVVRQSEADRAAYADHERLPEEAEDEGLSDVERAQAEAKALVEELHNEALERMSEAGHESVTTEPKRTEKPPAPARGRGSKQPSSQTPTTPEKP